ncbi:MAG: hypothetical protein R2832_15015 [Rhodothermales bacterium]
MFDRSAKAEHHRLPVAGRVPAGESRSAVAPERSASSPAPDMIVLEGTRRRRATLSVGGRAGGGLQASPEQPAGDA